MASEDDSEIDDVAEQESDEGDFFKAKNKSAAEAAKIDEEDENANKQLPPLSKKAMRRIKEEGPYAGLNKIKLDAEGN